MSERHFLYIYQQLFISFDFGRSFSMSLYIASRGGQMSNTAHNAVTPFSAIYGCLINDELSAMLGAEYLQTVLLFRLQKYFVCGYIMVFKVFIACEKIKKIQCLPQIIVMHYLIKCKPFVRSSEVLGIRYYVCLLYAT